MGNTGIATSLFLIAGGAILAFAVDAPASGIDLNAIGIILMVVGVIGLLFTLAMLNNWEALGTRRRYAHDHDRISDDGERVITRRTTYRGPSDREVEEVTETRREVDRHR